VHCAGHQAIQSTNGVVVESAAAAGEVESLLQPTNDKQESVPKVHEKNIMVGEFDPRVKFSSGDHSKRAADINVESLVADKRLPHGRVDLLTTEATEKERFSSSIEVLSGPKLEESSSYYDLKDDNLDIDNSVLRSTVSASLAAYDSATKYRNNNAEQNNEEVPTVAAENSRSLVEGEESDAVKPPVQMVLPISHTRFEIIDNEGRGSQQSGHNSDEVKNHSDEDDISDEEEGEEDEDDGYPDEEDDEIENTEETGVVENSEGHYHAVEDPLDQIPPDNLEFILAASGAGIDSEGAGQNNEKPGVAKYDDSLFDSHTEDEEREWSSLHVDTSHDRDSGKQLDLQLEFEDHVSRKS
jgi:hypothetical protein